MSRVNKNVHWKAEYVSKIVYIKYKTNDYIRRELRIIGILDKIVQYRRNWLSHLQRMPQNHTITDHKEGEQSDDRRSVGSSRCNSGDGTDQRVQSLMFILVMMVMIIKHIKTAYLFASLYACLCVS
jgi:hypothetical protein